MKSKILQFIRIYLICPASSKPSAYELDECVDPIITCIDLCCVCLCSLENGENVNMSLKTIYPFSSFLTRTRTNRQTDDRQNLENGLAAKMGKNGLSILQFLSVRPCPCQMCVKCVFSLSCLSFFPGTCWRKFKNINFFQE